MIKPTRVATAAAANSDTIDGIPNFNAKFA